MKKLILSMVAFLLFSIGADAQCFTPVWTEPSRDSMLIYVSLASLNGTNLQIGDEIGVFDQDVCVGLGVLAEELTGAPRYLVIEASRDRPGTDGFRPGRTIIYRFCSGGEVANPAVLPSYISNGPTFVENDSCIVELRAVNTAPTVISIPDTVATEDLPYSSVINAADIDGDSLIFSATLLPRWLSFNDTTRILSGTPGNPDVGYDTVTLSVFDGFITVDTAFAIRVVNVNDAPTITSIPDTLASEDLLYTDTIFAVDIDIGDSLMYSARLLPAWLSFNDTTHVLSGTPDNDAVGDHDVTLRVSDGTINIDTSFTIHAVNVNDVPYFSILPDSMALEDTLYTSYVTAEDIDIGDSLTMSALHLPDWLSFNDTTFVLIGTPANDHVGDHNVIMRINDGTVNIDTTLVIHVLNVNDAPAFTSIQDTAVLQGTSYSYTSTAEDIDGDTLIFSAPVLPVWLSFDTLTHLLSGTPSNDHVGDNHVVLRIHDGTVDVFQDFVIAVENVNDPPTLTSTPVTEARPGVAYSYTVTAIDIDGDELTYTALVLPGWLTFNSSIRTLSATPGEQDLGDQHVTIRISDGSLYTDHTFIITVGSANHAPTFTSEPSTSVLVGEVYGYTITAQDIDSDPLSYTAPLLPDWLKFNPETHVISGMPGSEDLGRNDITVRVSDGTVATDQNFPVFVTNVNSPPGFTSTPLITARAGDLYIYNAEAEDADGDDLSFSALTLPDWLSFNINTQKLHGIPTNDDAGDHKVTLRVTDGEEIQSQNFVITVDFVYGLEELSAEEGILIYPNPTHGRFFVELSRELEKEVRLEIVDPIGKVLVQQEYPPYHLINEEFNMSSGAAGIYFIRVYNDSFFSIAKFIMR